MKITNISISNFLGIGSVELDLSKYTGITLIEGVNNDSPSSVSNGSGKCLTGNSMLYNPITSEMTTIENLANNWSSDTIFSVYGMSDDLKLSPVKVIDAFKTGKKECVRLNFDDGTFADMSKTHPVYTENLKCEKAEDVSVGSYVASPRHLFGNGKNVMSVDEAYLLGVFYAEGGLTTPSIKYSNSDLEIIDKTERCLLNLFDANFSKHGKFTYAVKRREGVDTKYIMSNILKVIDDAKIDLQAVSDNVSRVRRLETGLSWETLQMLIWQYGLQELNQYADALYPVQAVRRFLDSFGVIGSKSIHKKIHQNIYMADDVSLSSFLTAFWDCDGFISKQNKNSGCEVSVALGSEELIDGIKILLLRLGIISRKKYKPVNLKGKIFDSFRLVVNSHHENLCRFYDKIGVNMIQRKRERLFKCICDKKISNANVDVVPPSTCYGEIMRARDASGLAFSNAEKKLTYDRRQLKTHGCSRDKIGNYANHYGEYGKTLLDLSSSDIYWKKIISVEDIGAQETYDITVDSANHLYATVDIITHNSSIIDAIFYGFFGKTKRGYAGDEVVNTFAGKNCCVSIDFEIDGEYFTVNRYRKDEVFGGLFSFIQLNGSDIVNLTKGTAKETQSLLEDVIGMSELTFSKILYFGQEDVKSFAGLSDAELKNVFEESLGLVVLSSYESKFKDMIAMINSQIAVKKSELEVTSAKLNASDSSIETVKYSIETFDKSTADSVMVYEGLIEKSKKELDALLKESSDATESLQAIILNFQEKELKYKELLDLNNKLSLAISEADHKKGVAFGSISGSKKSIEKYEKEIESAADKIGKPCVSCNRIVTIAEIDPIVTSIGAKISDLSIEKSKYEEDLSANVALTKRLNDSKTALAAGLSSLERMKIEADLAEKNLKSMHDSFSSGKISEEIASYEVKKQELLDKKNPYKNKLDEAIEEKLKISTLFDSIKKEIDNITLSIEDYNILKNAFSNAGIKSRVFDSITPELNKIIQEYLNVLDDISVEISTQKVLKSGDVRDKFEISVTNSHGASSYKGNSGGEKQKIDLCISLAFNTLMRKMIKSPLNILFLDEPFESLDVGSAESAVELCDMVAKDSSVFVITHNQAIKDMVSSRIFIEKTNGLSELKTL